MGPPKFVLDASASVPCLISGVAVLNGTTLNKLLNFAEPTCLICGLDEEEACRGGGRIE